MSTLTFTAHCSGTQIFPTGLTTVCQSDTRINPRHGYLAATTSSGMALDTAPSMGMAKLSVFNVQCSTFIVHCSVWNFPTIFQTLRAAPPPFGCLRHSEPCTVPCERMYRYREEYTYSMRSPASGDWGSATAPGVGDDKKVRDGCV